MPKYVPNPVPFDSKGSNPLVGYVDRELKTISQVFANPTVLQKRTEEPKRPQDGQIEYADGTNWNPGSGVGIYYYKVNTWVFLG